MSYCDLTASHKLTNDPYDLEREYQVIKQETIFVNQLMWANTWLLTGLFVRIEPVRRLLHPLVELE